MEIQSKIQDTEKRDDKKAEQRWNNLSKEEKRKMIEKINQDVDYKWDPRFWPEVAFQSLPPVLRSLVKKYSRKLKENRK